jgi:hypothetical protein
MPSTVCHDFEYEANTMIGNGNHENILKIILKIRESTYFGEFNFGGFCTIDLTVSMKQQ